MAPENPPPDSPAQAPPAAAAEAKAGEDGRMRILVVTGISGAGKSTALRALEDVGYFCVDNLPLPLMGRFVDLLSHAGEVDKTALVVDAREGDFLVGYRESFAALRAAGHLLEVLFLDAPNET